MLRIVNGNLIANEIKNKVGQDIIKLNKLGLGVCFSCFYIKKTQRS